MEHEPEKLWSLNEVAAAWGVDYMTAWRWVSNGKLPVIRLPGGRLRVRDAEVRRILGDREEAAVPA